ncbi:MAG: hypothetical protein HRT56_03440, partial [Coraliomargarita sp.]|nr:hypothetical protein [Coraliomargarita sp.]
MKIRKTCFQDNRNDAIELLYSCWSMERRFGVLRGGHMVKRKGVVASFAPHVGFDTSFTERTGGGKAVPIRLAVAKLLRGSAPLALVVAGGLAVFPQASHAQDECRTTDGIEFVCVDDGAAATDGQSVTGSAVTVQIHPGFEVNTLDQNAINVETSNGVAIDQSAGSSITGSDTGLSVNNRMGALNLFSMGNVTGANGSGIYAYQLGYVTSDTLTIDVSGSLVGGSYGI